MAQNACSAEHQSESILDLVFKMFQVDLGDGHLENFDPSNTDLDFKFVSNLQAEKIRTDIIPLLFIQESGKQNPYIIGSQAYCTSSKYIKQLVLRGPPSLFA